MLGAITADSKVVSLNVRSMAPALVAILAVCAPPTAAAAVAPLPPTDYTPRAACAPPAPGRAACLALQLVPRTAAARARTHPLGMTRDTAIRAGRAAEGADGLRPSDLRGAYFPGEAPEAPASEPQTIALVDAYDDPHAEADLDAYDKEFGLPACTEASGCFRKVDQEGQASPLPSTHSTAEAEEAAGWALETSTDIEMAHAVCRNCHVLLVEANSPTDIDLQAAEEAAVALGATEISNSWGGPEPPADSSAFDHPGTVITASAGDDGYLNWTAAEGPGYFTGASYPASSPHVVAVGGTELTMTLGGARQSERVWNEDPDPEGGNHGAGGGGCSEFFKAPVWQREVPDWSSVGCGTGASAARAVADVAADGDPYTGVAVYDSVPYYIEPGKAVVPGWVPIGGTSVASPIVASMFALAGGAHGVEYPAQTLYTRLGRTGSPWLYDVTAGGNGECDDVYGAGCSGSLEPASPRFALDCGQGALICNAGSGYDGPTGVGAPTGIAAFKPETAEEREAQGEETQAEREAREAEEAKAKEEQTEAAEAAEAQRAEEARAAEARRAEEERRAAEEAAHRLTGGGSVILVGVGLPPVPRAPITTVAPPRPSGPRVARHRAGTRSRRHGAARTRRRRRTHHRRRRTRVRTGASACSAR